MSFSVGIVGLPNVGKSTLFKALTKKEVAIAPRPFTTINPNVGKVFVPDKRLEQIADVVKPEKKTPTVIEFVDIAGLVKDAHRGEGLGNQFLAQIRNCDAILEIIRAFESPGVENVLGQIAPQKEIQVLSLELLMKDLETLEKSISKLEKKRDKKLSKKLAVLKKIKEKVSQGKLIAQLELSNEEILETQGYQTLTGKPTLYVLNINGKTSFEDPKHKYLTLNLKEEEEMLELSAEEKKELQVQSHLDRLIAACYNILDLITFFTVAGEKEVRAWTIVRGSAAKKAAGIVHSDFEQKFIKADVVGWQGLVNCRSWSKAREKGLIKTVGKDYIIQDGDVIEFKI